MIKKLLALIGFVLIATLCIYFCKEPIETDLITRSKTALKKNSNTRIEIIGHTDARRNAAYNQKLSHLRAQSVMQYLIAEGIELKIEGMITELRGRNNRT